MNRFVWVLLLSATVACSKKQTHLPATKENPYAGYTEYLIPAKQHYATNNVYQTIDKKELHFTAIFDSSCIYTNNNAENAYDINKLYGFSDCGSLHHENSARVGWLWNGKMIELYAYCYTNGIRKSALLGTTLIGTPAELSISIQPNQYLFTCNGSKTTLQRHCNSSNILGYKLYPYFGGNETAPHDIHVFIKES
ncbi:hypothetical protein [Niastella populi]|uniref:Lipoprotein n=1 Tax=Niastella populi TaxID=550983 RepID=A0A1V9FHA7_9BACT|nr:hypothetical protein [Niastella populi]OQP57586.1 hypothetical protein A4R26_23970 [Niastella populi]